MTEGRPAAEQPPIDAARRAALMFATLGFAALPRVPADMAPVFQALHQWLDGWKGLATSNRPPWNTHERGLAASAPFALRRTQDTPKKEFTT